MMPKKKTTTTEPGFRWALPEGLDVPPDKLILRLDIFQETIVLHQFGENGTTVRVVSALEVARAFTKDIRLHSGALPEGALWWSMGPEGEEVALWRSPRVWQAALVVEAFKPPQRFNLPMPGLVFVCSAGKPPRVFAAKRRPAGLNYPLYHAPLLNLFINGGSCTGTHQYGQDVGQHPEEFFTAFFSDAGHTSGRSKKYPDGLLTLWAELDGKKSYPIRDMVLLGTVEQVMGEI